MPLNFPEFSCLLPAVVGLTQACAYAAAAFAIARDDHRMLKRAYILLSLTYAISAMAEVALVLLPA